MKYRVVQLSIFMLTCGFSGYLVAKSGYLMPILKRILPICQDHCNTEHAQKKPYLRLPTPSAGEKAELMNMQFNSSHDSSGGFVT